MMNWGASNTSGWGILGLNLFSQWANDSDIAPQMGYALGNESFQFVDPLRLRHISNAIVASNEYLDSLGGRFGPEVILPVTTIDPLGNGFDPSPVHGRRNIGRCIFESTNFPQLDTKLGKYDALVCGSNWNAELLRAQTDLDVTVILEGVDPSLFCPGPKSGLLDPDRFYIFSGGKVEFRKGQDLVLLAFREFSRTHPDACLVTAWHSPWPDLAAGFKGYLDAPLGLDGSGRLDIKQWAVDNGIDPNQFIEIMLIPNPLMPTILREMDVVLQPSRAEACTNLPVKEAMGCGIPTIVSDNTGMKDLITGDNCVVLHRQDPIPDGKIWGYRGWGESSVDEIVEALEMLHSDPQRRRKIGRTASEWVHANRTWQRHAAELKKFALALE